MGNAIVTKKTDDLCYGLFYGIAAMNFCPGSARTAALFLATRSTYEVCTKKSNNPNHPGNEKPEKLYLIERIVGNILLTTAILGYVFGEIIYSPISKYIQSEGYQKLQEGTIPLSILCIATTCHFIKSRC